MHRHWLIKSSYNWQPCQRNSGRVLNHNLCFPTWLLSLSRKLLLIKGVKSTRKLVGFFCEFCLTSRMFWYRCYYPHLFPPLSLLVNLLKLFVHSFAHHISHISHSSYCYICYILQFKLCSVMIPIASKIITKHLMGKLRKKTLEVTIQWLKGFGSKFHMVLLIVRKSLYGLAPLIADPSRWNSTSMQNPTNINFAPMQCCNFNIL